jgi:NAD+ kinase
MPGARDIRKATVVRDIRSVGLVIKRESQSARLLAQELAASLRERRLTVLAEPPEAAALGVQPCEKAELAARADLIVSLGGDGTLLSIARFTNARETPILGINLGGLGFLTQATSGEARASLERVLAGEFAIDRRIALCATIGTEGGPARSPEFTPLRALNDIVISKRQPGRMLEMEVIADGQRFCTYRADGLIIATPTGSTAYALSAGGPIIFPTLGVVILAPICPHTLSNRPVVLPDICTLTINARSDDHDAMISIDGQEGMALEPGDQVVICKDAHPITLVKSGYSYFEIWRNKLKWG